MNLTSKQLYSMIIDEFSVSEELDSMITRVFHDRLKRAHKVIDQAKKGREAKKEKQRKMDCS